MEDFALHASHRTVDLRHDTAKLGSAVEVTMDLGHSPALMDCCLDQFKAYLGKALGTGGLLGGLAQGAAGADASQEGHLLDRQREALSRGFTPGHAGG